jgi:EAL domain-containing protein (putative c-di-GMP-specific phosphodiesterase class I)
MIGVWWCLRAESCDNVQGYFIGRPQPIDAYAEAVGKSDWSTAPRREKAVA